MAGVRASFRGEVSSDAVRARDTHRHASFPEGSPESGEDVPQSATCATTTAETPECGELKNNVGPPEKQREPRHQYTYTQQGSYGDVELATDAEGRTQRVTQLQAAGASSTSCLPTALLAFTRNHTQGVRLDSCAQFSVAGIELRKYGRCVTRDAPVNVVEGFGGGQVRVLGVWRFAGTTRYQQRITVDALLVDGQGDEFLIGED
jgi:hypothetical protein